MQPNQCSMRYILMGSGPEGFLVVRGRLFPCLEVSLHCPRSVQDILEEKMAKGMGVGSWDILWMRAPRPAWCGLVTRWRALFGMQNVPVSVFRSDGKYSCLENTCLAAILSQNTNLFGCYFVSSSSYTTTFCTHEPVRHANFNAMREQLWSNFQRGLLLEKCYIKINLPGECCS